MKFWLLAFLILLAQEALSTNIIMLQAHRDGRSVVVFSLVFLVAFVIDVMVGIYLANYWVRNNKSYRIINWANGFVGRFGQFIGKWGKGIFIFILSLTFPPIIASFLGTYIKVSLKTILVLTFIGDSAWYASCWLIVFQASKLAYDTKHLFIVALCIAFAAILAQKIILTIMSNKK